MTSPPPRVDRGALLDGFRRYLRDHGLPVTQQRQAVAEAVLFAAGHSSALDIEQAARDRGVAVGKATVYRTLELLKDAGIVHEHDFGEGFKRYEPRTGRNAHEHLICTVCGKVIEFSSERLDRMNALIAEEHGFRPHHHRLEIYGVCHDCQRRDAATLGTRTTQRGGAGR